MESEHNISPYPGLRPFTEDEAVFFKGRDTHIAKIHTELSAKRFLMVTGASGDGTSSLIYAGLLPNVRAGFFKGAPAAAALKSGALDSLRLCLPCEQVTLACSIKRSDFYKFWRFPKPLSSYTPRA